MKKLLQKIQDWRGRPNEDSNQIFERIAADFKRDTGYLRPGKDCQTHSREERNEKWEKWTTQKNNELDDEIAEALERNDGAQYDRLSAFILNLDCGHPKGNVSAVDSAIAYIKELRSQITTDPRAIGAAGWNTNRKDVIVAGCHRCGVVEPCLFTHDPGQKIVSHNNYWCYKCYMEAKR